MATRRSSHPRGALAVRPDSMRVVPEGPLKGRAVAESSLDIDGPFGGSTRVDVRLLRPEERRRSIWMSGEDRLTPHNDKFAFADYLSGRSDDVIEILTSHLPDLFEDLPPFGLRQQAGEWGVLP